VSRHRRRRTPAALIAALPAGAVVAALATGAAAAAAQPAPPRGRPAAGAARARPDTARPDTARLAPVTVTVTRTPTARDRAPWAVGVVDAQALRAGRLTVGLDEALADVPGVYVANRYNFSVDQRLSVRGLRARANFGTRGVRILLDGVPQTFPDGQSQLTNVDLANLERVEVLRGAASSLYGNASGGVLDFRSDLTAPARGLTARAQAAAGAYGVRKVQARAAGRLGPGVAALSASRTGVANFRDHARAEQRRLTLAADRGFGTSTTGSVRLHLADDPRAENPGALTPAEYAANPDAAALANVRRGADKRVSQQQLALALRRDGPDGARLEATAHGVLRDLWNPLATPPPGRGAAPSAPGGDAGTLVEIARRSGGARLAAAWPLARLLPAGRARAAPGRSPVLTLGAEWQGMRDRRTNRGDTGGRVVGPADTLLLDQVERVEALAPFAQLAWAPSPRWTLDAGARRDRVRFAVADRFLRDGRDDSGARTLGAASGHAGASYAAARALAPYANVSSAFETPTTTELQAPPAGAGTGGFNADLGPQRARGLELGARGALAAGHLSYTAAAFRTQVDGAIVQWLEAGGRAFFRNAGATRGSGVELGLALRPLRGAGGGPPTRSPSPAPTPARGCASPTTACGPGRGSTRSTAARCRRARAVRARGGAHAAAGVRAALAPLALDADHTWASSLFADDRNTLRVRDWGRGLLDVRLRWDGAAAPPAGGAGAVLGRLRPFVAVQNAFGQRYVGSVTVNGAFGRVLEPAPGRTAYAGLQIGG
jgi:iron complex outermembrane receptor protein